MNDAAWIVGYVALSVTVLGLVVATADLYRRSQLNTSTDRGHTTTRNNVDLKAQFGDRFPIVIDVDGPIIVVVAVPGDSAAFGLIATVCRVAAHYGVDFTILIQQASEQVRTGTLYQFIGYISDEIRPWVRAVNRDDYIKITTAGEPSVTWFVEIGIVRDSLVGLKPPELVAERIEMLWPKFMNMATVVQGNHKGI